MTFRGLRLMLSVIALTTHSLAAPPAVKFPALAIVKLSEDLQQTAESATVQAVTSTISRKTEIYNNDIITTDHGHGHGYSQSHQRPAHQNHHAISTLIHLLFTIGSAFAPLVGAIVGPLLTNIANGVTWAISHTIASGFSPHGLFSPELGHGTNHVKEHPTSYTAEGQPETGSEVQQPVVDATLQQAEPTTVDDTRNEAKKII